MAELDFSKIFGETATSKASFTDENYLNGWGYLGSTPPPYQLFDYLQSLNDQKSKYLYDMISNNQTALTGTDEQIKSVLNTLLGTGAWDTPATNSIANIINLVGLGGIVAQRLEENGYVKFANGFTIQWGTATLPTDGGAHSVSLPIAINYAMAAQVTVRSSDFAGYVVCPYWSEATTSTITITTDYEIGQGYSGTGSGKFCWVLVSI